MDVNEALAQANQEIAQRKHTLNRFRYVVAEQTKALKELRAENERLQIVTAQSADAMTCLQAIYTDPDIKPEIRAAAAKAVLPRWYAIRDFALERATLLFWSDRASKVGSITNRRQFGAFRTEPGNPRLRRTAWWGWEDSNFQPNDYQPPALSIEHSGAVS
jgi:hypothetical protein